MQLPMTNKVGHFISALRILSMTVYDVFCISIWRENFYCFNCYIPPVYKLTYHPCDAVTCGTVTSGFVLQCKPVVTFLPTSERLGTHRVYVWVCV